MLVHTGYIRTGRKSAMTIILLLLLSACFVGCQLASMIGMEDTQTEGATNGNTQLQRPSEVGTNSSTAADHTEESNIPDFEEQDMLYYSPLTGLPTTAAIAMTRPMAVCIGNTSAALPQYGVGDAEILFEVPVEGGSTRLMALTGNYGAVRCFGSVRSTRDYLQTLANSYDAISVFAGKTDVNESVNYDTGDSLDYIGQNLKETFYRDVNRQSPHNLMTSGALLSLAADDCGYRLTGIQKSSSLPYQIGTESSVTARNERAIQVDLPFSSIHRVGFSYDSVNKVYTRTQNGAPHTDAYTQKALSYTNILILYCDSVSQTNAKGDVTLSLQLKGEGTGCYIYGGKMAEITWRKGVDDTILLKDKNGKTLTVAAGKTYMALFRTSSLLSVSVQ